MDGYLVVLNAGSSSLKFCIYGTAAGDLWQLEARGQVEGIGTSPRFSVRDGTGRPVDEQCVDRDVHDASSALGFVATWFRTRYPAADLIGVGHRVVHGGIRYTAPAVVTPEVLEDLCGLVPLAPLHQPYNLAAIVAVRERLPDVRQVACFDTSFHRGQPEVATIMALPEDIRRGGVQRYGFHGLSYGYIASALPKVAPELASGRAIVAHLGNGASMCAMNEGKSIDSTLGFTALDGLCMGTRPGAVDPGVILYLFQELGLSAEAVQTILYKKSGLLGLSGISNDMRDLLASDAPAARLAIDYFVYRAAKEIGALAAVLGGVDGLVFTGGIGENSAEIRQRIARRRRGWGSRSTPRRTRRRTHRISTDDSRVSAWVIPANEELMIARHTGALLGLMP